MKSENLLQFFSRTRHLFRPNWVFHMTQGHKPPSTLAVQAIHGVPSEPEKLTCGEEAEYFTYPVGSPEFTEKLRGQNFCTDRLAWGHYGFYKTHTLRATFCCSCHRSAKELQVCHIPITQGDESDLLVPRSGLR